jgi:hypothetical protein
MPRCDRSGVAEGRQYESARGILSRKRVKAANHAYRLRELWRWVDAVPSNIARRR